MSTLKTCIYCENIYEKDTEHVFPHGLGGQKLFINCVCEDCNRYFSGLERELYQKSFVGLLRSTEGVAGYKPKGDKRTPFKAPILLTFDQENELVYEVGQYYLMQVFLRPQIMEIEGEFYLEGDTTEGIQKFVAAVKKWRDTNLMLFANGHLAASFTKQESGFTVSLEDKKSNAKGCVYYSSLPDAHELFPYMAPRLFIDDSQDLRVRAKSLPEAMEFLRIFLNRQVTKKDFNSYTNKALGKSEIYVGFGFDGLKLEQALVKIGLNCLCHYYPEAMLSGKLTDLISYVKNGQPCINARLGKKDVVIDSTARTHNIFFYQQAEAFVVRISLFSGQFVFSFWINDLHLLKPNEYNRLVVRFDERINAFETHRDFLGSFSL